METALRPERGLGPLEVLLRAHGRSVRRQHQADDVAPAGAQFEGGVFDERGGVLGSERDGEAIAGSPRQLGGEAGHLSGRHLVEGRRAADGGVPPFQFGQLFGRGRAAPTYPRVEGRDVGGTLRGSVRHDENPDRRVRIAHPRVLSACTRSTTAARIPTSASGSTPCPRLNTCPVPVPSAAPRAITCRVAASTTGQGAHAEGRIQIALHGQVRSDASAGRVERHPPVDTDHVGARRGHEAEELTGAHAEKDGGHAEVRDPVEDGPRGREDELLVLVGGERTGPAVEELDRLRPGLDLGPEEGHRQGGQTSRQPLPQGRVTVHQ